jgi:membrane fusion protein, multidrug efflux system
VSIGIFNKITGNKNMQKSLSVIYNFFKRNKVLAFTIIFVIAVAGYCLWLNRKPFTQNAFVVANIRTVSAYVPGYITDIYVKNNETVAKGKKLFTVFQKPYQLQIQKLEKELEATQYKANGLKHSILIAENQVKEYDLIYKNTKYLSDQAVRLTHVIAEKEIETREKTMQEAYQEYKMSIEQLEIKKNDYKQTIATIESLRAQVANAELDLQLATVYAETPGMINNMYLSKGTYVQVGEPLFAFVDTRKWWVQANFTETQLSQVKKGMKAKVWLWQYPGVVFHGIVTDTGWGVGRTLRSQYNAMPEVQKENQWFMLPQRFPVQVRITDIPKGYQLHPGGSAYVQVETSAHPIRQFFWRLFQL